MRSIILTYRSEVNALNMANLLNGELYQHKDSDTKILSKHHQDFAEVIRGHSDTYHIISSEETLERWSLIKSLFNNM